MECVVAMHPLRKPKETFTNKNKYFIHFSSEGKNDV